MIEHIVALLMFVGPDIKEHRIQVDPDTGKYSMHLCMKHKREASRPPIVKTYLINVLNLKQN